MAERLTPAPKRRLRLQRIDRQSAPMDAGIESWPRTAIHAAVALAACLAAAALAAGKPAEVEPTAEAVLKYLQQQDYRNNWKFFPGRKSFYRGVEPHGALLTTYVNAPAHAALQARQDRLPPGAMLVKENYTPARTLDSITVMFKSAGFDPKNHDWFWMKRLAGGDRAVSAGRVEACAACHGTSTSDYIMTKLP